MIVALVLVVIIAAPVTIFTILKNNSLIKESEGGGFFGGGSSAVSESEVRQLASKASRLVKQDLGNALREKTVTIDFVSVARNDLKKADRLFSTGKNKDAKKIYDSLIQRIEDKMTALKAADQAKELRASVDEKLEQVEPFKSYFEAEYDDAIAQYNEALVPYETGDFEESLDALQSAAVSYTHLTLPTTSRV